MIENMEKDVLENAEPKTTEPVKTTMEACLQIQREVRQILLEETRASKHLKESIHEKFDNIIQFVQELVVAYKMHC